MVSATSDRSVTTNNLFRKRTTPALSLEVMRAIIVGGLGRVPAAVGGAGCCDNSSNDGMVTDGSRPRLRRGRHQFWRPYITVVPETENQVADAAQQK